MKNPVIKKQTHYNLLLMRDDSEARTFRLHGNLLRFFLIFLFCLMLAGSIGIAGGIYYFGKYRILNAKHNEQERELAETRLQLERLANFESLLAARNGTMLQAKNEEVGASPAPGGRQHNATGRNATLALSDTAPGADNAMADGNATGASLWAAGDVRQSNATAAGATGAGQSNATAANADADATASADVSAQSKAKSLSDPDCPVRTDGFTARAGGAQRLHISYELSTTNPEEQRTVSGIVRHYATFTNGTRLELPLQDIDGTRFSILRMKPIQSSVRLPSGYSTGSIESIDLFIDIAGGGTFHQAYPFTK